MARGKSNHIFPAGHYLFCDKLMGERKWYFFPFPYFYPSQTVTVLRCMKMTIFTLGYVHSSACVNFNDFVMNNPDNCSFNHFFFPVYFYQVPFSLLP
jgi:hypothetical protein